MDAIEKAIRSAFEKGNALDPAFREKVYRSVLAALDRAVEANPNISPQVAEARRAGVLARIEEIESEFVPAVEVEAPAENRMPSVEVERRGENGQAPSPAWPEPEPDPGAVAPENGPAYDEARLDVGEFDRRGRVTGEPLDLEPHRRAWPRLVAALVLLAAVGGGIWWAASSGFFRGPEVAETETKQRSADTEGTETADQAPAPAGAPAAAQNWINVFSPDDPTPVSAPADAEADVLEDESGKFLRIRSGQSGSPVAFGVGQGILERIAGRSAVFDIVARAEEGKSTQISVACDFGQLGDCGRKRYMVGYEQGEFLFEIAIPDLRPQGGGTISITSDIENNGRAIDVYEIRVTFAGQ